MPERSDQLFLADMLEAIDDALAFGFAMSRERFAGDRRTVHAVCRCLEIIGEAAGRLSLETIVRSPEVPWAKLRSLRNRIVHACFDVDVDLVHEIVTKDLQGLRQLIAATMEALKDPNLEFRQLECRDADTRGQ